MNSLSDKLSFWLDPSIVAKKLIESELNKSISDIFSSFDKKPMGTYCFWGGAVMLPTFCNVAKRRGCHKCMDYNFNFYDDHNFSRKKLWSIFDFG